MSETWRDLELLVAKIQAQLAPDAAVEHNVRLRGRRSGRSRQIDVLVKQKIGQYEMLIVLDCKDYAAPIDVTGVEAFHGLLEDVGAHRGALVCPKGFTAAAKTTAAALQIDLYSPVDSDPHKWQARVEAPIVCDFRSAKISFGMSFSAPMPMRVGSGFWDQGASDVSGKVLGSPFRRAVERWNAGQFPIKPGEHEGLQLFETPEVLMDNGYGKMAPFKLQIGLLVEQHLYFGHVPVTKMSGFRDELSGGVITNAFTLGMLDPAEVADKWQPIATVVEAPVRPLVIVQGLMAWAAPSS